MKDFNEKELMKKKKKLNDEILILENEDKELQEKYIKILEKIQNILNELNLPQDIELN